MRGKALIYSIITYLCLITISTIMILLISAPSPFASASMEMLEDMKSTGLNIYQWITGLQILLVLIIAPTITAGMTTGEKERKTFDFLRVTTITRWMYILGSFLSTAFYVALALICAMPLLSLTFLYGGVSLSSVLTTFVYLLGTSCVLSAFGLFVSSICDRTRTAQGIIVFLIFGVLFGGFILYQQLSIIFAGANAAASAGNTASATQNVFYLFNYPMPKWVAYFAVQLIFSGVFLLLAARKLFDPTETRSLSQWQFTLIYGSTLLVLLGVLSANQFTRELPEILFLLLSYLMIIAAAGIFAIGRMEVGDEIWHIKRIFSWLRPIDQTIPFLVLIALSFYYVISDYQSWMMKAHLPEGFVFSFLCISISSFAFFCFFGRAMTGITTHRPRAVLYFFVALVVCLIILPVFGAVLGSIAPSLSFVARELALVSPLAALIDVFNNPAAYSAGGYTPGMTATAVYAILAVGVGLWGETKRFLKFRGFDYHYDMPAG